MGERVKLADAKRDIEAAFYGWTEYSETDHAYETVGDDRMPQYQRGVKEAESRVMAFLAQVEADQERIKLAKVVCAILLESRTPQEIDDAKALAAGFIEGTPMTEAIRRWEGIV